jgi:hypothetical protein
MTPHAKMRGIGNVTMDSGRIRRRKKTKGSSEWHIPAVFYIGASQREDA